MNKGGKKRNKKWGSPGEKAPLPHNQKNEYCFVRKQGNHLCIIGASFHLPAQSMYNVAPI